MSVKRTKQRKSQKKDKRNEERKQAELNYMISLSRNYKHINMRARYKHKKRNGEHNDNKIREAC